MRLPYAKNATIAPEKLTHYLLNEAHEDGRTKAVFFRAFGFSVDEWQILRAALLAHVVSHEVTSILETTRGKHYAVEGPLDTPSGRRPLVRTVWMLEEFSDTPRFITAYPLKVKRGQIDDSGA